MRCSTTKPVFVLRKLQLNRHRDAEVAPHGHDYAQLILYLTGEGVQTVKGRRRRARAGDLFVIPAGAPHGFSVAGHSRPLCLVLDYELEDAGRVRASHRLLQRDAAPLTCASAMRANTLVK